MPDTSSTGLSADAMATELANAERQGQHVDQAWVYNALGINAGELDRMLREEGFPWPVSQEGNRAYWNPRAIATWQKARQQRSTAAQPVPQTVGQTFQSTQAVSLDADEQLGHAGGGAMASSATKLLDHPVMPRYETSPNLEHPAASSPAAQPKGWRGRAAAAAAAAPTGRRAPAPEAVESSYARRKDHRRDHKGWKRRDYVAANELPPGRSWPVPLMLIAVVVGGFFLFREALWEQPEAAENPNTESYWESRIDRVRQELLEHIAELRGDVERIDGELVVVDTRITSLDGQMASAEGAIAEHQTDISANEERIAENNGQIDELKVEKELLEENVNANADAIAENLRAIGNLQAENRTRKEENQEISDQIDLQRERVEQLEQDRETAQQERDVLRAISENNSQELVEIGNRMRDMQSELAQLRTDSATRDAEQDGNIRRLEAKLQRIIDYLIEQGFDPDDVPQE